MNANFKDHFSGHAQDYRRYRPDYPPALFAFLATLVPHESLVWDCGTGNGQAAVALAGHFEHVFATDASARQISEAEAHPRVEYAIAPAEHCPLPNHAASLVTVAQAMHWFDLAGFYGEVNRVCRPGGYLAAWTYDLFHINDVLDSIFKRFHDDFVGPYWPPERALVSARYTTIPFPFESVETPFFEMKADWDLPRVLGYLNTWSSTKAYIKARGFNPVETFEPEFARAWGNPSTTRTVRWDFILKMGRVGTGHA